MALFFPLAAIQERTIISVNDWLSIRHGQQAVNQLVTQLQMEVSDRRNGAGYATGNY